MATLAIAVVRGAADLDELAAALGAQLEVIRAPRCSALALALAEPTWTCSA